VGGSVHDLGRRAALALRDGLGVGHHYWNRLADGTVVDLTGDQFLPAEVVVGGEVVVRPPEGPRRHRERYELLRDRVLRSLEASS